MEYCGECYRELDDWCDTCQTFFCSECDDHFNGVEHLQNTRSDDDEEESLVEQSGNADFAQDDWSGAISADTVGDER